MILEGGSIWMDECGFFFLFSYCDAQVAAAMFQRFFVSPTFHVAVGCCRHSLVLSPAMLECVLHRKAGILLVYILNEGSSYVYYSWNC